MKLAGFVLGSTLVLAIGSRAQQTPAVQPPARTFEVVSVRPAASDRRDRMRMECSPGGRFILRGTPLLWAVKWAYGWNDYQVSAGWPAWLNAFGAYDIEAKADGPATQEECRTMVQSLFADRFKLRMHAESKIVSAYALQIAAHGIRLHSGGKVIINGEVKQSVDEAEPPEGWTMARLANYLASVRGIDRPVLDRTGLAGAYGFTLTYSRTDADDRPNIFTAVREQLGLRLSAIKAPVDMFVIDHVEKPGAN